MEGSRNERVTILTAAYIIGFITAYIAFGVTQLDNSSFASTQFTNTASVINAANIQKASPEQNFVAMTKEGLILVEANQQRLLSATKVSEDGILPEGYHSSIADYSVSPDGMYVYFCETPAVDSDSCRPYIYSVQDTTVYPVKLQGERVAFEVEGRSVSWDKNGAIILP